MNHIQLLKEYQQDDKNKTKSFEEGELILWLPRVKKIKGNKFKLSWESPYKMQKVYSNNTMELNILNNNHVQRVNINKLKKYHHGEPPIVIMTTIVNIEGRIKSVRRKNEHTT
jgi:hypothetical protein